MITVRIKKPKLGLGEAGAAPEWHQSQIPATATVVVDTLKQAGIFRGHVTVQKFDDQTVLHECEHKFDLEIARHIARGCELRGHNT